MPSPVYGLEPILDPAPLLSPDILEQEFVDWVEQSQLLKRAFREVAVIGGLVERQHPGKRKTGRQVSFSTDLIYDVLRKYEPGHLLMKAAWEDARARMTELGRLARLVERAAAQMVHVAATRVTPMAVPLMVVIGRESASAGFGRRNAADRGRSARRGGNADRLGLSSQLDAARIATCVSSSSPSFPPSWAAASSARLASTAVDVVTLPVKVVSAGVDAATTSQSEADENRGRALRKADEQRAKDERKRCKPYSDRRLPCPPIGQ